MADFRETLEISLNKDYSFSWAYTKVDLADDSLADMDFAQADSLSGVSKELEKFTCSPERRIKAMRQLLTSNYIELNDEF